MKEAGIGVKLTKKTLIRGKFRLGENAFASVHEKTEKIMKEVDDINKRWTEIKKSKGEK